VANIAEKVKISVTNQSADDDEEDDTRLCEYFPKFVWAVRDFTLELSIDGKAISADEYLENALTLKKGFSHFSLLFLSAESLAFCGLCSLIFHKTQSTVCK